MLKLKIKMIGYGIMEILSFASCSVFARYLFSEAYIGVVLILLVCGFSLYTSMLRVSELSYEIAKEKAKMEENENANK